MKKKLILTAIFALLMLPMAACGDDEDSSVETHDYVKHDAVAATCQTAGNEEYYTCNDCSKLFDAAKQEINAIPVTGVADHSYVLQDAKAGTCVEAGKVSHYTCETCDKLFNLNRQEITSVQGELDTTNHAKETSVVLQQLPTKLVYKAGETFDPTGMVMVYKCDSCEGDAIDARYLTYTYQTAGATAFTVGDTKITVFFNDQSVDINVTVEKDQVQITGVESVYTTSCGVAPQINAVCSIPNLSIVVEYYQGATKVEAADFAEGNTYTAKVSVAETTETLGATVTATINVTHSYDWDVDTEDADKLVCECVCGAEKDYYVIDNQMVYVDNADMSLDLSKLVGGTTDYTVKSIQQVLTLNGNEKVAIDGTNEGMVYTFDVEKYEKTPTQEGDNVVYYTPYDLVLAIEYQFADGNTRSVTLISKYVEKVIRTAEELSAVMYTGDPSAVGETITGYYALGGDIDASGLALEESSACYNAHSGFAGTFDGNGYTISNLTIPAGEHYPSGEHYGLFGAIGEGARIQNVNFTNVTVGKGSYLLAYAIRNAFMTNVSVSFSLESTSYLVAYTVNQSTLENISVHTCKGINPFLIDESADNELPASVTLSYHPTSIVTFDTDGGNAIDPVEVTTGKTLAMPENPVKDADEYYYQFQGWYLNGAAYDFNAAVTEDITLVAQWDQISIGDVIANIAVLPDEVTMPDHIYFVSRIRESQAAYNALPEEAQAMITNYAKLESLLEDIYGYETVYTQSVAGVDVIPSYVPNYTSAVGGSASVRTDDLYGNVLTATSDAEGRAAIQFKNFPNLNKYNKIYVVVRVIGTSCDIYLSDGITNDGWGDGWNNSWSLTGLWVNDGIWNSIEFDLTETYLDGNGNEKRVVDIFSSNWALGLRTETNGVTIEITDIFGSYETQKNTGLTFGNFVDSGETNEHGTVYNFTQGWSSNTDMGAFNANVLVDTASGYDYLTFWIYNPQDVNVNLLITGDANAWNPQGEYVTSLTAKGWTQVILTKKIIEENANCQWFVNVSSGAGTSGWQISSIYAVIAE